MPRKRRQRSTDSAEPRRSSKRRRAAGPDDADTSETESTASAAASATVEAAAAALDVPIHAAGTSAAADPADGSVAAGEPGSAASDSKAVLEETDDELRERFLAELEFVQALANPGYLNFLAQQRYFQDEAFVKYLDYLQYWRQPEYVKFIVFPHCLHFLALLQQESFRAEMMRSDVTDMVHKQQFYHWQYYARNRNVSPDSVVAAPEVDPAIAPAEKPGES